MKEHRGNKRSIRSMSDLLERSFTNHETGCIVWKNGKDKDGYGRVRFNGKPTAVHRLSWVFAKGDIPDGMLIMHSCDNPPCFNIEHLSLGTDSDNHEDSKSKGRAAIKPGYTHRNAKLTDAQVLEIRNIKGTQQSIADLFGISRANVSIIKRGIAWSHLPVVSSGNIEHYKARGEKCGASKLTADDVLKIRASRDVARVLAERFCVSISCINAVLYRKTWKHI